MKRTLASLVVILSLVMGTMTSVWAADFQKGYEAYKQRDYATALREWRPLAKQGNAKAQFALGLIYDNGEGVVQDYKEAVKWWRLAAKQGYAKAQFNMGVAYYNGLGVVLDNKEAVKWYRLAAEQGDAEAQINLGVMYVLGQGVIKDDVMAHMWGNIAAANGEADGSKLRDAVAKWMNASQLAEAQKLARECAAKKYKGC